MKKLLCRPDAIDIEYTEIKPQLPTKANANNLLAFVGISVSIEIQVQVILPCEAYCFLWLKVMTVPSPATAV